MTQKEGNKLKFMTQKDEHPNPTVSHDAVYFQVNG